jgi:two-component system sensor histidine kinase RegB
MRGSSKLFDLHIHGMFVCFALAAVLLVFLVTRINRNLRDQDARLSQMRQHAVEQEHIVRMGLLASGAAHELSTPLATLSVILQDWERMPLLASDPEFGDELQEMTTALARCKEIVSRVLLTAGEIRAERMERTTIVRFLDEAAREWRSLHAPTHFAYCRRIGVDSAIAPDLILKQTLFNLLDNALEASPDWVGLQATRQEDFLVLTVRDKGPGFPPDILARFGKPYRSTKDRPESGLGLFLVVNVLRKLGGSIEPRNGPDGGAVVEMKMPIGAMSVEERDGLR